MFLKSLWLFLLFGVLFPSSAHAYVDPGTGSLILQALIAGGVSALAFFASFRRKILSFFKGDRGKRGKKNA